MILKTGWSTEYQQNRDAYVKLMDQSFTDEGENVEFLERQLEDISGRKYAVVTNSATDALYLSLLAYDIGPGDEVLVTNFSWISTSSCISMVGATPVFCDIDLESYHISLDSIKRMYSDKVKALIYTPLYGNMTDTTEIEAFCKEKGIVFVEDSAQAIGSSLNGRKAGSIGDCSSYSFNINKVIPGPSGGGVFLTDDHDIAHKVTLLRRHGKGKDFELLGINSKPLPFNCSVISHRLTKMEEYQTRRQEIAAEFIEAFEDYDLPLVLQKNGEGLNHNYHKFVVRFNDKDSRRNAKNKLKDLGIPVNVHYERPLNTNSMYDNIYYRTDDCVNAQIAADTVLTLPMHAWLTDEQIDKILNYFALSL